jgi:hypothetical protein
MSTALLLLLAATCWAGEVFGVWKLNPIHSTLATNQKTMTVRIEPHARGEVFTLETVASDGRASTSSTILYLDGRARDFQDSACSGTQLSRRLDDRTVEILRECGHGAQIRLVRRLSHGALTLEITEHDSNGRRSERSLVLEKH